MNGFFKDKRVLIIGGTGTIGQSIMSTVLKDNPKVVRILSRDEYKQFEMQQTYRAYDNIRYLIGDIRDFERVKRAMQDIDYVFHCAAMKHVPSCEYNPFEAVQTNILGTQNVIQASIDCGVVKTVFTSTDKAIAPANTYGASKLMAERLIAAAQYYGGASKTIFSAVRFGNVMGSRGSVIPLFQKQIVEQSRITVTCKDMSRFMMTKREATELTIKAMMISQGGEVFVLKMPIIRLQDLAECIVEETSRQLGILPSSIRIEEIGLRPGEKMYEELMTEEESSHAIELPEMFVIPNQFVSKPENYGGNPAIVQSYSSHSEPCISKEAVRRLLRDNELLGNQKTNHFMAI
ncbi:polysaccharide biosynthesis protein [Paenibacillus cellulosilyticus]|uniref:Polysaccharide biosynthesis protein n=1 Tax=Paenibacillus cellulosilyticus TaxID=375489 RepID=A0A2V2Z0H0_9BACL|nr:SDR family NAD(P)-dependent oxidoreductase [Paenibacillus cellulosilyticus]PWW08347.1 polysaccharide biosynthesis protein [Paenibacillus cellulosilyticus]QKS47945.1 SDR family NAD(P)-dependent oxidoreductase [Paenibacillus cellulosilyticus]